MNQRPIFIGGMFKSGTSLLRAMIGQHPNIASGLETYWFDIDWDKQDDDLRERLGRLADLYDFDREEVAAMAATSPTVYAFLSAFLGAYATRLKKGRWAEKTPGNIQHMDRIVAGWGDAQIVHIIRDPKDVFASLREARKWDSIAEFTERWCNFLGAAEQFRNTLDLNGDCYFELRYEALVADPAATTRALFDFLGEEWSEDVASFAGKSDDYDKVLKFTGKDSTTLKRLSEPLTGGRIGIWRDVLEEGEIKALRAAIAERGLGGVLRRIEDATSDI